MAVHGLTIGAEEIILRFERSSVGARAVPCDAAGLFAARRSYRRARRFASA